MYCDRDICARNEYNDIDCNDCVVTRNRMTCGQCKYYHYDTERGHLRWWCYNEESDNYGAEVSYDDGCKEGERKA